MEIVGDEFGDGQDISPFRNPGSFFSVVTRWYAQSMEEMERATRTMGVAMAERLPMAQRERWNRRKGEKDGGDDGDGSSNRRSARGFSGQQRRRATRVVEFSRAKRVSCQKRAIVWEAEAEAGQWTRRRGGAVVAGRATSSSSTRPAQQIPPEIQEANGNPGALRIAICTIVATAV